MWKQLQTAVLMMSTMTVITGLAYPAAITAVAQRLFPSRANGSLVVVNGQVVGSRLLAQSFSRPEYFHPRPSAAGAAGYDATASGGSQLGPTSAKLFNGTTKMDANNHETIDFDGIKDRVVHYCLDNEIPFTSSMPLSAFRTAAGTIDDVALIKAFNDPQHPLMVASQAPIPADAVTASASGLDPDISPANADIQARRVAKARGVSINEVAAVVALYTHGRTAAILGEPTVGVLELNLALDRRFPRRDH
jgi:K+-transporting ATPase ATPase C chain